MGWSDSTVERERKGEILRSRYSRTVIWKLIRFMGHDQGQMQTLQGPCANEWCLNCGGPCSKGRKKVHLTLGQPVFVRPFSAEGLVWLHRSRAHRSGLGHQEKGESDDCGHWYQSDVGKVNRDQFLKNSFWSGRNGDKQKVMSSILINNWKRERKHKTTPSLSNQHFLWRLICQKQATIQATPSFFPLIFALSVLGSLFSLSLSSTSLL